MFPYFNTFIVTYNKPATCKLSHPLIWAIQPMSLAANYRNSRLCSHIDSTKIMKKHCRLTMNIIMYSKQYYLREPFLTELCIFGTIYPKTWEQVITAQRHSNYSARIITNYWTLTLNNQMFHGNNLVFVYWVQCIFPL